MRSVPTDCSIKGPVGSTRPNSSVLPKEFSWLNVPIPKAVHAHVKFMASLSNMSLKEYLAWFLRTAQPRANQDSSEDIAGATNSSET